MADYYYYYYFFFLVNYPFTYFLQNVGLSSKHIAFVLNNVTFLIKRGIYFLCFLEFHFNFTASH